MMGEQRSETQLFSYAVNLEKRVRADHPLRRVAELIDFKFVREEVAHCYGSKGNVSVDPEVILKMMFLLFFDDVASERELMKVIAERSITHYAPTTPLGNTPLDATPLSPPRGAHSG
jgi:transposase